MDLLAVVVERLVVGTPLVHAAVLPSTLTGVARTARSRRALARRCVRRAARLPGGRGGANVGLLLDAAPDLVAALEPLRQTAELVATDVRATT